LEPEETEMSERQDDRLAAIWDEHRRYVLDVAYRMLGSITDAEDVVQETFARLLAADLDTIEDVRGWLVVVATRLCLDQLRSARAKRESYVGPWLPEPVIEPVDAPIDPADRITLDDSVRMAMLVVLERLTPAERAAFVLHDVFRFSFDDVARIVGRTTEASRQLASRARKRIEEETGPARFEVDREEVGRIADRFIEASTNGDFRALMDVLDPDVAGWTDTGGLVGAPRAALTGREQVASRFLRFLEAFRARLAPMRVNGEPGVLVFQEDRLLAVIAFETREGLITRIHSIANPHKLAYVSSMLGAR
jgi:RNA polymerase sigma-70 factor (ECF subfamily)